MKSEKIPQGALRLQSSGAHACAFVADGEEATQLQMIAYSGGIISDHYYWGNLVIDLAGMKFTKKKYPILEDHWSRMKIAFTGKPVIEENKLTINPKSTIFVDTPESTEFQKLSKQGFPYESSIYAEPSIVERIEEGASSEVNGFTLKGPARIWRQCEFKEASVCVFGYDDKTEAKAFAKEVVELSFEETIINSNNEPEKGTKGVKTKMNIEELKKDHPDLVTQIEEGIRTTMQTEVDTKLAKQKEDFEKEKGTLETTVSKMGDQLLSFEKKEILRTEREVKAHADSIWDKKLSDSDIPDHLFDKVRKHVSHSLFSKDDVVDWDKFSTAVGEEIKSWEDGGVTTGVMGSGGPSTPREVEEEGEKDKKLSKENDETAKRMLKLAGQEVPAESTT